MFESQEERQARLYEQQMGRRRRYRQEEHTFWRFPCCWEHRDEGHHPLCVNAPEREEVVIDAEQMELA